MPDTRNGLRPIIEWRYNEGVEPATPPPDANEWEEIVAEATGRRGGVLVVFVSRENGSWWISKADRTVVDTFGSGPINTTPIDLKDSVKAALRAKGKPVID